MWLKQYEQIKFLHCDVVAIGYTKMLIHMLVFIMGKALSFLILNFHFPTQNKLKNSYICITYVKKVCKEKN